MKSNAEQKQQGNPTEAGLPAPSYNRYNDEQLKRTLFALEKIAELAADRRVWIYTIPVEADFIGAQRSQTLRLPDQLQQFANQHANFTYMDLLPVFMADIGSGDWKQYSLGCDAHWGARGNQLVADAIYEQMLNSE